MFEQVTTVIKDDWTRIIAEMSESDVNQLSATSL